jgi:uncharacterized phiE125 gp8 family phage protein
MGYKVITPVAGDVIPLADLRLHLRLDMFGGATTHPDDALIQSNLLAAREYAEHYTQRSIGQQTLELALDSFPDAGIELELGAATITSIKYVDTALVEQTIASNLYTLDDYSFKHWAIPVDSWPTTGAVANAVKVRYTTPAALPAAVTQALLLLTGHLYENREAVNTDRGVNPGEVPLGVKALLDTVRHWSM